MKKFTLYVIRWSEHNKSYENSKPCKSCIDFLKKVGIGTIIYTTGDKDIYKKEKVTNLNSTHISSGMKNFSKKN